MVMNYVPAYGEVKNSQAILFDGVLRSTLIAYFIWKFYSARFYIFDNYVIWCYYNRNKSVQINIPY